MGRGLMPDTSTPHGPALSLGLWRDADHQAPCRRDAFRRPVRKLLLAQRYQFLSGWLPWISDALAHDRRPCWR